MIFHYTARSAEGRFVSGALSAESAELAMSHLRLRSLFVTAIQPANASGSVLPRAFTVMPASATGRVVFFRSLATLVRAGVPIRRALEVVIAQTTDSRLVEALRSVAADIEDGVPFSSALSRRPREFTRLIISLVRAGEAGGALDDVLEGLASMVEANAALRKRIVSAMSYPLIVAAGSLALIVFLVSTTIPAFETMFVQMHVEIPPTTRALIVAGHVMQSPAAWIAGALTCLACAAALRRAKATGAAFAIDRAVLKLPAFGPILRKATIARFSRTLGTLLRSGVPLTDALHSAADVLDNAMYERAVIALSDALAGGDALAGPIERTGLFDPIYVQLVRVGEETGSLDAMFFRLAQYYDLEVETALSTLSSIVEPLLITILGAVVATIVASILLPLYSMIGNIK